MGDELRPTRDDYVRIFLLDRFVSPVLLMIFVILVDMTLMWSQGGLDGMRRSIEAHIVAADRLRQEQKRKDDLQYRFSRPGWRPYQPGPDDDNYAK